MQGALILEDCARTINKAFTVCATDRCVCEARRVWWFATDLADRRSLSGGRTNTGPQSRRQGLYKMAAMSIKSYFKVCSVTRPRCPAFTS